MKRILVLGAGQSSPCLIDRLLEAPVEVRVADRDADAAARAVAGAARGAAVGFDATDEAGLRAEVGAADMVVNLLAPSFQVPVARACLAEGRSMVSASYRSSGLAALADEAEARGLSFASELGLDPGLDHMSAMRLLETLRGEGRTILAFESYGAGIADPDTVDNPLGYVVTWNPRNVVMAGEAGARFVDEGGIKVVPYPEVFRRTWTVEVPGLGPLDAYPNRDSFAYVELYGLKHARRVLRATMRAPGFTEAWYALAKLGLANETITIPGLADLTWRQLTQCFLPEGRDRNLETRLADHLGLHRTSAALRTLRWLGLFERTRVGALTGEAVRTPAEAVRALLTERLRLPPDFFF